MAVELLYPLPGFHFAVVFTGIGPAAEIDTRFQEVTGLNLELAIEELVEGGENRFVHKMPVRTKFPNLILKRGLSAKPVSPLIDWVKNALYHFEFAPCSVLVTLMNEKHLPAAAWRFEGVFPVKWSISDLKATENSVSIETLELSYKYFQKMSVTDL